MNLSRLLLLVALIIAMPAYSENGQVPVQGAIELQPSVCVVKQDDAECDTVLQIEVIKPINQQYCIVISIMDIRQCFAASQLASLEVKVQTSESLMVELIDPESNEILASQDFEIAVFQPVKRHRRRYAWSLL